MKNVGGSECVTANSTPVNRLGWGTQYNTGYRQQLYRSPKFFGFVCQRLPGVHGLHPQNLVVALLVIEHRMRKVIKHVLRRQLAVCLNAV